LHRQRLIGYTSSMRITLVLLFFFAFVQSIAQCLAPDFATPSAACINQKLEIQNLTSGASSYEWDFCSGDLALTPQANIAVSNNLLFRTRSIRLIEHEDLWFGFTIDQASSPNRLIRFDFGNSLVNNPTVTDLGNPSGQLNGAYDFQMYQEADVWYALVANTGANTLLRLNFGSNPQSMPAIQNLGSFGVLNIPNGIFLASDNGVLSAFVTNGATSEIVRLDFGNSILNLPIVNTFSISGGSGLRGIAITRECDRWFGLVTSYGNGKIFWLDFTNGLTQHPQSGEITFFTSYNFPTNVSIALDGGEYVAFIQSALGEQYRLAFGASIIDKTGAGTNLGNYGISNENFALELVKVNSDWFGFTIDLANRRLVRLTFPTSCDANLSTFNEENPPLINYSFSGLKNISLIATSATGSVSSFSKVVSVSASMAPDINFVAQNSCVNNSVIFSSENVSGGIATYNWNFGDAGISSLANPTHVFSSADEFSVTLTVAGVNGCQNLAQKSLTIYSQPSADFSLPEASPICTNQNYNFINTSSFDAASNPTWEWSLNGIVVSTALNLSTQFSSDQPQVIKLKSSIPGCESEKVKNISSVQTGPLTDFTFSNGCEDAPISFINTTSGAVVDYAWDFDDGNTSTQQNAINTFEDAGRYQVTLHATNLSGCQNFVSKEAIVYSNPQPNFSLDLPPFSCAGSVSQFNDLTPSLTDSNLTAWSWSFGDAANGGSTQKNPGFTYTTAGDYDVTLQVTSNFGCSGSVQKPIIISSSPAVNFTYGPACLNQGTQFTDASGADVKAWLWSVQNSSYTTKNATHVFSVTGTQIAMLTVTGNNNCVSQISKTITIPVPISPDFTSQSTCATKAAVFTEINSGGVDPAVSWSWDFAGQATGTGSTAEHIFNTIGNYPVRLSSTRQSGCVYSVTKAIPISQPPQAQFAVTSEAGGAPLTVGFTNTSTSATSFLWKFNDAANSTSSEYSPTFVFNQLGAYPVELVASTGNGCQDSFIKTIQVLVPEINAVLKDFILTSTVDDTRKATVTIENKSNVALDNPVVLIDLSGNASISETFPASILPNQSFTYTFSTDIIPRNLSYACAEVQVPDDIFLFDNRECVNLLTDPITLQPYPNPAQTQLFIDWINQNQETLTVFIYNSAGQIALERKYTDLLPGLNQVVVYVNDLASGIYFVSCSAGEYSQNFRFSIVR